MDSKTKIATSRFAVKFSLALSGLLVTGGMATAAPCPVGTYCYPGYTYTLPTVRPYIKLTHYQQVNHASTPYIRFKQAADAALAGNPPYAYSATHSATMFALSGNNAYIQDAITRVETFVAAAEAVIAGGGVPEIAYDSYLDVGFYMEDLALTYDWGYSLLTVSQRQRWEAFAAQTLFNVWNPDAASWGGVPHTWSGWSISDPGNNYHFSFLRATMLWAWATKNTTWLNFLQTQKFPPLVNYYALLPGGGSREGTGYGTAMKNLFLNYLYWVDSTTENLALLTPHTRETIDYWVHATVPTRDHFAPIGDQSRSSLPELYDYHENLVQYAVALSPGTNQARHGTWWLQNNSVNGVSNTFNLHGDLLTLPDAPLAPTELFYHATGAGALFARSSWLTDASWLAIVAGKYDQSHAHQDQGSFTFFRGTWLAVTQNIWSHSGINQEVDYHNVIKFKRSNGTTIAQAPNEVNPAVKSTMTPTSAGGVLTVVANLTNAYWTEPTLIQNWQRTFTFAGNTLTVTDACTVAAGVTPVFQVQVPVQPTYGAGGTVLAGAMTIKPLQGETATFTKLPTAEFNQGWRVDFAKTVSGCSFKIEMSTAGAVCTPGSGDNDGDSVPDSVEVTEGTNPCIKDNDVFTVARRFAMQQYRDFLGREGDAFGISYWTTAITGGTSRATVTKSFFDSPEFQGAIAPVTRLYFAYFNRIPDKAGLDYWIYQYRSGTPLNTVSQAFAASAEFVATYGSLSNSAFVTLVYNNVLGRAPDAAGSAYWVGQLNSGAMSRGQVMVGFSESAEYKARSYNKVFVTMMYYGMLRRVPDQPGFDYWVGALNGGIPSLNLISGVLAAPEYRARFLPPV